MKNNHWLISICFFICLNSTIHAQDIFTTLRQGDSQKITELLSKDSSLANTKNPRGFAPIHFAANFNLLEIAKILVEYGANPQIKDRFGRQAIHWAANGNNIEIIKWLNELDVDLASTDDAGRSVLYYSITENAKEVVNFLLEHEVPLFFEKEIGFDILYSALLNDYSKVISAYMDQEFDFTQETRIGNSLLFAACQNKNEAYIMKLVSHGLDINASNAYGDTPLSLAIQQQNIKVIQYLIEQKVDLESKNPLGKKAIDIAKESENKEIMSLFEELGTPMLEGHKSLTSFFPDFNPPGKEAKLFGPGYISTEEYNERDVTFSPNMDEFYFSRNGGRNRMRATVHKMDKYEGYWNLPQKASFSGKFNDSECFVTHDNKKLFFISQRPEDGSENPEAWEIWIADRQGRDWTNFHKIDTLLKGCFYPTITYDGELIYTDAKNNLWSAKIDGETISEIKKLSDKVNTEGGEYNSMISPDGSFLIFTSHGYEDHYGGGDLYISFRDENGEWKKAINMGEKINTASIEYCPSLSPDGKYFFFSSRRKGNEDIYWIDAQVIQDLKNK